MGAWQERAKRSWRCVVAVTALLVCPECKLVPSACGQETTEEYRVKAVYLRKISDFVQWPAAEGAKAKDASEVVRLCVVGSYAFGALLAQEAGRATLSGKKMEVLWTHKELDFKGCQIIFVSRSENKNYAKILEAAKGMKALTVGETGGFLDAGGIVELNYESDALKFEVSLAAARQAQLRLDARLLAMARRVIRDKEPAGT
jgi:hypothetical protein